MARMWQEHGIEELSVRIGVHTGMVIAGNMGSQHTMKYGVVGDTVNVAARLEQLNNQTDTSILVSAEVYEAMSDELKELAYCQGEYLLKGRNQCQHVFSIGGCVGSDIAGIESIKVLSPAEFEESPSES